MNTKKRIDWVDVAKGIAMILVIVVHAEEHFMPGTLVSTKIPIYTFHMPLFFFMSGYLFSMKNSFGEFLKNKCRRILIPYVCLGVILALFNAFWAGRNPFGEPWFQKDVFFGNLWGLLFQNRMWTLWFIACLFWLNIIFYVIARYVKSEKIRALIVVLMAAAGIIYYKLGGGSLYWNVDVCFTAMPFFYAGYLCRKTGFVDQKILGSKLKWALFIGFVLINMSVTIINYLLTGQFLEFFGRQYGIAILTYIGAFAGTFAVIIFSDACRGFKPLKYIGENSMMFYALHQTMLLPVIEVLYQKVDLFQSDWILGGEYYSRFLLATVLCCVFSAILNEIICRLKLGFMVGK